MPRDLFVPAMNERVGMNDRGRPSGSPLRWPDRVGARHCLALIRRRPASPTIPRLPRDLFVPAMNERVGMNVRGRPSGSPLRWPDRVGARHCLALIRRRPAPPTISEAMPRDLFVPAMNERVGMNGPGRPSGSPLRYIRPSSGSRVAARRRAACFAVAKHGSWVPRRQARE